MDLGAIEAELKDIWTDISFLKSTVDTSPQYLGQLNDLRSEIADLKANILRIQEVDETLQELSLELDSLQLQPRVEDTLQHLSLEFEQFRRHSVQRQKGVEQTLRRLSENFELFKQLTVQRLEGIEQSFLHVDYEFQLFRGSAIQNLNAMDVKVVNNERVVCHYLDKVFQMSDELDVVQPVISELSRRLETMVD